MPQLLMPSPAVAAASSLIKAVQLVEEAARPGSATTGKPFGAGWSRRFLKQCMGLLEAHAG